jgi:hypothetical protein
LNIQGTAQAAAYPKITRNASVSRRFSIVHSPEWCQAGYAC